MVQEPPTVRNPGAEWHNRRYEYTWEPPRLGGFGTVFKARDKSFPKNQSFVAIKQFRQVNEHERQFEEEVERLKSLSDRCNNVVKVVDFFSESSGGFTKHFLVMEWIATSLEDVIKDNPRGLPVVEALDLAIGIGRALSAIHEHGLVHSDLKPANVLLLPDRTPRLIDFGIMEEIRTSQPLRGLSPGYAPREQALGLPIDRTIKHRIDLFPFGVICFQLLTGSHPFPSFGERDGTTKWREILSRQEAAQTASGLRGEISGWPELDSVLSELLSHDPRKRPDSGDSVVKTFQRIRQRGAVKAVWLRQPFNEFYLQLLATIVAAIITFITLSDQEPAIEYFRLKNMGECAGIGENPELEWKTTGARVEIMIKDDPRSSESKRPTGTTFIKVDHAGVVNYQLTAVSRKGRRTVVQRSIRFVNSPADCPR